MVKNLSLDGIDLPRGAPSGKKIVAWCAAASCFIDATSGVKLTPPISVVHTQWFTVTVVVHSITSFSVMLSESTSAVFANTRADRLKLRLVLSVS